MSGPWPRGFTPACLFFLPKAIFAVVASVSDVLEPIKSVLDESVAALKPAEVSLDAFNSQYLQHHSSSASAVLASAKVSHILDAPREEVESVLFTTLADGVQLCLEVR